MNHMVSHLLCAMDCATVDTSVLLVAHHPVSSRVLLAALGAVLACTLLPAMGRVVQAILAPRDQYLPADSHAGKYFIIVHKGVGNVGMFRWGFTPSGAPNSTVMGKFNVSVDTIASRE